MRFALRDLARHPLGRRPVDVGHRDMGAGLGERVTGRAPDAGAAAGHQRDPPVQSQQPQIIGHLHSVGLHSGPYAKVEVVAILP
jgi:hypothetical protein